MTERYSVAYIIELSDFQEAPGQLLECFYITGDATYPPPDPLPWNGAPREPRCHQFLSTPMQDCYRADVRDNGKCLPASVGFSYSRLYLANGGKRKPIWTVVRISHSVQMF